MWWKHPNSAHAHSPKAGQTMKNENFCKYFLSPTYEAWTQSHVINPINLTLSSKVKVVSGSWMYLTHPLMVIDPCAKYGMPMSKQTEVTCWTWRHDKSLRSKVNIQLRSWMYATHRFMVIHPCAKYGKPMSNQKIQHTHWGPPNILQSQGWSFRF